MKLQLKSNTNGKRQANWLIKVELTHIRSEMGYGNIIEVYIRSYCSQSGYDWCVYFFSFNFDVSEQICVGFLLTIDPIRLLNNIRQKRIQLAAHAFTLCCILYGRFMLNKIERKIV